VGSSTKAGQKSTSSLRNFLMSSGSHSSRRTRGLSPEINHVSEIGRRKVVLETLQGKHRRSLSDSSISSVSFIPITFKMTSFWFFFWYWSIFFFTIPPLHLIESIFSHQIPSSIYHQSCQSNQEIWFIPV
jgi:hypothetical protein